ncbi:hypothetical protein D3C73_941300 [compost metagenome]
MQYLPVFTVQPSAIAQHQGRQRTGPTLGVHRLQALADTVAPGPAGFNEALAILDGSGGTDALRQQPGVIIEGMRIEQPGRTFQFHRQSPALAAADRWPAIPGQTHHSRHPGLPRTYVDQFETHHRVAALGQPDHASLDPTGFPIEVRRQSVIQRPLRIRAGPTEAEQEKRQWISPERQQHQTRHGQYQPQPCRR